MAHSGDKIKYPRALNKVDGFEQKFLLSSATKMQKPGKNTKPNVT